MSEYKKRNIADAYYDEVPVSGHKRSRGALQDEEVINSLRLLKQFGVKGSGTSRGILIQPADMGKLYGLLQALAMMNEWIL